MDRFIPNRRTMSIADSQARLKMTKSDGNRILNFGSSKSPRLEPKPKLKFTVYLPEQIALIDAPNAIVSREGIKHVSIDSVGKVAVALDQEVYIREDEFIWDVPLEIREEGDWIITGLSWGGPTLLAVTTSTGQLVWYNIYGGTVINGLSTTCICWQGEKLCAGMNTKEIIIFNQYNTRHISIGYDITTLTSCADMIAVGCVNMIVICGKNKCKKHLRHDGRTYSLNWHPTKTNILAAGGDKQISIWDVNRERNIQVVRMRGIVEGLQWNSLGTAMTIILVGVDKPIETWLCRDKKLVEKHAETGRYRAVSSSMNSSNLAVMYENETLDIWRLADPQPVEQKKKSWTFGSGIR